MKRPPDRDVAAREIQQSNAMCVRALGGQWKPWMSGDTRSSSIRNTNNTERPREHAVQRHGQQVVSQGVLRQHHAHNPAASNEKPISAACVQSSLIDLQSHVNGTKPTPVEISPAPSEDIMDLEAEGGRQSSRPGSFTDRTPRMSMLREGEQEQSDLSIPQEHDRMELSNTPHLAVSVRNEPLGSLDGVHREVVQVRTPSSQTVAHKPAPASLSVRSLSALGQSSAMPTEGGSPVAENPANIQYQTTVTTASGNSAEAARGRPPNVLGNSPPTNNELIGIMSQCSQATTERLQQTRNEPGRLEVEVSRLELVLEASEKHDIFYIMAHQIYCLNTLFPLAQSAAHIGFKDVHSEGLRILSQLLLDNDRMSLDALRWFSTMPLPFDQMLQTTPIFRSTFGQLLIFLEKIKQHWIQVKNESRIRNCPYTANEMAVILGMHSLVLQSVLFRAILRDIWPGPYDHCFQHCEKVFNRYQHHFLTTARASTHMMTSENQAFQNEVQQAWAQHQQHAHHRIQHQNREARAFNSQVAPQQNQANRSSEITATRGQSTSSHGRNPTGRTRGRPPRINTLLPQQVFSVPPSYTPTFHNSPTTPADPSRTIPQHVRGGRQSQNAALSRTHLPSTQSPTLPSSIQGANGQTPATVQNPAIWRNVPQAQGIASASPAPRTQGRGRGQGSEAGQPPVHHSHYQTATFSPGTHQTLNHPTRTGANSQMPSPRALDEPFLRPAPLNPQASTSLSAFHQSHATSPTLKIIGKPSILDQKYFTYLANISISPDRLHAHKRHLKWTLALSGNDVDLLAKTSQTLLGHHPQLDVDVGSRICRIRCIKINQLPTNYTESDWVSTDVCWPSSIAILLNGQALEVRKKSHHSKDLPINITSMLKVGENTLTVAVSQIVDGSIYALAVETSEVIDTRTIKARIPTLECSEAKNFVLSDAMNPDPEIVIVDPRVVLNVTDPFSSYMCSMPVRGKACRHKQCFDLDNFLATRSGRANEPCGPDQFRCPICGADARPQSLIIDGFVMQVKEQLWQLGRPDVKAIILYEHGNWQIKEEEQTGESGDGTGKRKSEAAVLSSRPPSARRESEVIDLDSDD